MRTRMEAKDTVNSFIKLDLNKLLYLRIEEIKQQQAIISFNAGMKKVIEFIESQEEQTNKDHTMFIGYLVRAEELGKKLKEWKML